MGPGDGFSGVIVDGGSGQGAAVGDEVVGTVPAGQAPSASIVCHRRTLAPKPAALAHAEAAILASVGPAALRATRLSGARPRDRVLVTGAGSDAGAIAVQLAKLRGSHVTAVCPARDVPLLWDLGADEVIASERGAGDSGPFRAVIDTDQSVTPEAAALLLEPDGRLVAIRDGTVLIAAARALQAATPHAADDGDLLELVDLVERDGVFPVPR